MIEACAKHRQCLLFGHRLLQAEKMKHSTQKLLEQFPDLILESHDNHAEFSTISSFDNCTPESLVFVADSDQFSTAATAEVAAVVCDQKTAESYDNFSGAVLISNNVRLAQAKIKQHYQEYDYLDAEWDSPHPTATIHPTAKIGNNCHIGPGVIIGKNCVIEDNVVVRNNSVIEHDCHIGSSSVINSLSNIGYGSVIGERVMIQSGVIIGNEGYGFAADGAEHHRIPHTGNVVIEDDAHIGSNTCVDRGTYGSTRIGKGVKIDNLCHIAHNVEIGDNSLFTAQSVIAGSSKVGKRVMASGQTGVLDHTNICDDVVLVHRAGVTSDITEPGMYAGTPIKPFKEYARQAKLANRVERLERQLKELSEKSEG